MRKEFAFNVRNCAKSRFFVHGVRSFRADFSHLTCTSQPSLWNVRLFSVEPKAPGRILVKKHAQIGERVQSSAYNQPAMHTARVSAECAGNANKSRAKRVERRRSEVFVLGRLLAAARFAASAAATRGAAAIVIRTATAIADRRTRARTTARAAATAPALGRSTRARAFAAGSCCFLLLLVLARR